MRRDAFSLQLKGFHKRFERLRTAERTRRGSCKYQRERLAELEQDKAALLETYSEKASKGLDYFTPDVAGTTLLKYPDED